MYARYGTFVGVVLAAAISALWHLSGITFADQLDAARVYKTQLFVFIFGLLALFFFHEAIHTLLHPGFGARNNTVVGVSAKPLIIYAAYIGVLSRNRYITILLAPFLILSLVPALLGLVAGRVNLPDHFLAALSVFNAAASGGDILGALLLLSQVPRNGPVKNSGWQTYWRRVDA